jgi:hypothetical protein
VDENNPYDKLQMTVTLPNSDPLYKAKRDKLQVRRVQGLGMRRSRVLGLGFLGSRVLGALASGCLGLRKVRFLGSRGLGVPHGDSGALELLLSSSCLQARGLGCGVWRCQPCYGFKQLVREQGVRNCGV